MSDEIRTAAVVYGPETADRQAVATFAKDLQALGVRVGGVIQEAFFDEAGRRCRVDAVDLSSGERVTINRPNREQLKTGGCSLDPAALADAGAPLRRALAERPDLVVVEKFGEQEQTGGGLADDILSLMAEGLPMLVLVPETALADWREMTAGVAIELPCERAALARWWQELSGSSSIENGSDA